MKYYEIKEIISKVFLIFQYISYYKGLKKYLNIYLCRPLTGNDKGLFKKIFKYLLL